MLLLDNYDSFTYNLWHYFGELGAELAIRRNDELSVEEAVRLGQNGIVLSPGPSDPDHAGITLALIRAAAQLSIPTLGVCLGHQAIGQAFGGQVVRAPQPIHGKVSTITHTNHPMFAQVPEAFEVARYHSLVIQADSRPAVLKVTAQTSDGLIMAVAHQYLPIWGVQFHPESIASQHGHQLLRNWLNMAQTIEAETAAIKRQPAS
jgi:anthranilate synthase component 2